MCNRPAELAATLLIALATVAMDGCANQQTVTRTGATREAAQTPPVRVASHSATHLNNPAQLSDPETTIPCDRAKVGHACVSGTTTPSNPNQFSQRNCDTNIVANSSTSCGFAENTFYEYYESPQNAGSGESIRVHSPATGKDYSVYCSLREELITCNGEPLSTGIYVSFPNAGDEAFCNEHQCIGDFENENGYVVECADGDLQSCWRNLWCLLGPWRRERIGACSRLLGADRGANRPPSRPRRLARVWRVAAQDAALTCAGLADAARIARPVG
jgi:hypothetical protein